MERDDEITSDELDELIDEAETLETSRPDDGTEVHLYVSVDAETCTSSSSAPQTAARI